MPDIEGPLDSSLELSAEWWLPATPATRVQGKVTYEPDYLPKAEFSGGLGIELFDAESGPIDSILGSNARGEAFTLLRNWPTHQTTTNGRISLQSVIPDLIVVGQHIPASEDFAIDRVEVRQLHLEPWIGRKVFGDHWAWNAGKADEIQSVIKDIPTDVRRFEIASINGSLSILHRVVSRGGVYQFLELNHVAKLVLEADGQKWFKWYLPKLIHLDRLMTLLVQAPVRPRGITVYLSGKTEDNIAQLYYARPSGRYAASIDPRNIALPLPLVEDIFESVLGTWFEREDLLRVPLELYIDSLHHRGPSLAVPLLDLIRAVEVFHRTVEGGTVFN